MPAIINYVLSFLLNFLIALIVVRFIYYPEKHNKNYVFTFLAFNADHIFCDQPAGKG